MSGLPQHLARWADPLVYDYESSGAEILFRNTHDPKPRSRRVFAFHTPATLLHWLQAPRTLRAALADLPPLIETGLRTCQIAAIQGLERSLAADHPRALIQLATGAGKTFTACSVCYRLIRHAATRRILFLVDRNNLGDQTLKEFQSFQPPGTANRFTDTYIVQQFLTSTLSHLNILILFAINFKLHTTAFAFMRLCCCFYLVFTTAVELFVFAQILPRPSTFTQHRGAHQLRPRSGINRLLLARSLRRHQ